MSNSLWPQGLQHARLPCPSLSSELAQIHVHRIKDAIQTSYPVTPFSFSPQSSPTSGSFPMSRLFASGGQIIGTSASVSVLLMNTHSWFPSRLTGLISLLSNEPSRVQHHSSKVSILWHSSFFMVQLSHLCMTAGKKNHSFDYMDLCQQSFKNLTIFKIFTII